MGTVRFTKVEFEKALPREGKKGKALWVYYGFDDGEHVYKINVRKEIYIMIRSSVREDGKAAERGKDSIRCWLAKRDDDGYRPIGHKVQAYVTRRKGWPKRLTNVLRELWKLAMTAGDCGFCHEPFSIYKVHKEGKNKGRWFAKCWPCENFKWLDSNGQKEIRGKVKLVPDKPERVAKLLTTMKTIKAKVEWIRKCIKNDDNFFAFALKYIYDFQTSDEKVSESTHNRNNVGFGAFDAEILTSLAKQVDKYGMLSKKQIELGKKKMVRYSKQIERELRP